MKYIEKHDDTEVALNHKRELQSQKLDEKSLLERKNSGEKLKSGPLYANIRKRDIIPHFPDLLKQMYREQGGICCYCGCKLLFPDTAHYSVEHVQPRSKNIELVGEYRNLLLSCHLSEEEHRTIDEEVANLGLLGKKAGTAKRERFHCDEHKDNDVIPITPLDLDCEQRFSYFLNGDVKPSGEDDLEAQKTIDVLNLNHKLLVNNRRLAIYYAVYAEADTDLLVLRERIMNRNSDDNFTEYSFAIKSYLDSLKLPQP